MLTDQKTIYQGLSHAAWGYFFLTFDFKLGAVNLIPRFVGFLLLLSAASKLSGPRRDLALLKPLCILLSAWNGADWLLSWFGGDVDGKVLFLDLLIAAAELYFHFQFLTDMAALAEMYQGKGDDLDQRLRNHRTIYVIICTASALFSILVIKLNMNWQRYAVIIKTGIIVGVISALLIIFALFALRRCVKNKKPEDITTTS